MTNKQTLPDIIEIAGVKYQKVEEPQKPKTLYQILYDDKWANGDCNMFCEYVEGWMTQYNCDYVVCTEYLKGHNDAMKTLKENLR